MTNAVNAPKKLQSDSSAKRYYTNCMELETNVRCLVSKIDFIIFSGVVKRV